MWNIVWKTVFTPVHTKIEFTVKNNNKSSRVSSKSRAELLFWSAIARATVHAEISLSLFVISRCTYWSQSTFLCIKYRCCIKYSLNHLEIPFDHYYWTDLPTCNLNSMLCCIFLTPQILFAIDFCVFVCVCVQQHSKACFFIICYFIVRERVNRKFFEQFVLLTFLYGMAFFAIPYFALNVLNLDSLLFYVWTLLSWRCALRGIRKTQVHRKKTRQIQMMWSKQESRTLAAYTLTAKSAKYWVLASQNRLNNATNCNNNNWIWRNQYAMKRSTQTRVEHSMLVVGLFAPHAAKRYNKQPSSNTEKESRIYWILLVSPCFVQSTLRSNQGVN